MFEHISMRIYNDAQICLRANTFFGRNSIKFYQISLKLILSESGRKYASFEHKQAWVTQKMGKNEFFAQIVRVKPFNSDTSRTVSPIDAN